MSVAFEMKPIGTLCRVSGGKRIPKGRSLSDEDTGFKYLRLNDFSDRGISLEDMKFLPNDLSEALSRYRVAAGDIVISVAGTLGMTRKITADLDGAYLTENADRLSGFCGVLPDYILHVLSSEWRDKLIASSSTKSGQPKLALERIRSFQIPVPSAAEQQKIVEILSDCDAQIDAATRRLRCQRTGLKGMRTQFIANDAQARARHLFSEVFSRITENNGTRSNNVLTISGQLGLVSQTDYFNKSVAGLDLSGYTLLERGDFAFNRSYSDGYPMGAIKSLERYDEGVVSSLYMCFRMTSDVVCHDFMRHYFESGLFNRQLVRIVQEGGRAHGLLNLNLSDFYATSLFLPSLEEQEKVASVLCAAEAEIELSAEKLDLLKQQKRGLMQQLLTGKLRVKGAA